MKLDRIEIDNKMYADVDYRGYIIYLMSDSTQWEFRAYGGTLEECMKNVMEMIKEIEEIGEDFDILDGFGYEK